MYTATKTQIIKFLCDTAWLCQWDFFGMKASQILKEYDTTHEEVLHHIG